MSKSFYICLLFLFSFPVLNAQQDSMPELGRELVDIKIQSYHHQKKSSRRMMHFHRENSDKINPFFIFSAGLMYLYQNILSEQIQAECVYTTSCSEYTKLKIEKKGLIIGILAGNYQLMNCFTGVVYDYPWYKITKDFKVKNEDE